MSALIKLVVPPFVPPKQPSIGIGSLVSVLKKAGFRVQACYLNLAYLQSIGEELYNHLTKSFRGSCLSGEFLFTPALWPQTKTDWNDYENVFQKKKSQNLWIMGREHHLDQEHIYTEKLADLYATSDETVTRWAKHLLSDEPDIIGFSTTFQQTIPSLALARKIKNLSNGKISTILGGANCRGEMGRALFDNFPWLDYVVAGEGEAVIVDLVKDILHRNNPKKSKREFIDAQPVADLNQLPTPDFHDYFTQLKDVNCTFTPNLSAESSRGCWWGSKNRCTFCSLNGDHLTYRCKSTQKVISEIHSLHTTYTNSFFMMADNILHQSVATALHREFRSLKHQFFYEIKANQTKEQLIQMAQTGIHYVQPGIESLSTSILKHINKGSSQLKNIQTLKYCTELKLVTSWNILLNLPGETEEDYRIHKNLIPKLIHLIPPSIIPMRLERFSTYFNNPEKYHLCNIRHAWPFDFIFSMLPASQRKRLASFFEYSSTDRDELQEHTKELISAVDLWRQAPRDTTLLLYHETVNGCFIIDSRTEKRTVSFISSLEQELLQCLDGVIRFDKLYDTVKRDGIGGEEVSKAQLLDLLHMFEERSWVINESDEWLTIVTDPTLKYRVYQPGRSAL